jgi:uncharacterized Zn finger protein
MKSPFTDILSLSVLLNLAGERFFERGEDYYRRGAVHSLTEFEGNLTARVLGTYEYRVKFWAEGDGRLRYSCSCPVGADGLFCKHCVAVGLTWLEEAVGERQVEKKGAGHGLTMDEVRTLLEGQNKEVLVRLILEQAMEDERLQGRLMM